MAEAEADQTVDAKPEKQDTVKIAVALDGEGLRFVNATTGSTRLLAFGTERATAEQAIAAQLGPVDSRTSNQECGAGPVDFSQFGDFTANFQDGKFVGWALSDGDKNSDLTTMSGIGIGTERTTMAQSITFEIDDDSSIGTEFHTGGDGAGGLSGLLDSDAQDARITDLWAGTNCIFR
ncbi:hypothetical protein [Parasphingorhabdus sp.]|uniref:hypothetical protein n=1 Tax=Parasphingorhabdus sp. TaxID=2709688 RepID=UPI003A955C65